MMTIKKEELRDLCERCAKQKILIKVMRESEKGRETKMMMNALANAFMNIK